MNKHWWKTYRVLSKMKDRLKWAPEELDSYRLWKLRELLKKVYTDSPFYRHFYEEHGVNPNQVETLSDLKLLPVLRKKHLCQTDPMQVLTRDVRPNELKNLDLMEEVTSGSSGQQLRIFRTWRDLSYTKANDIRAFQQTGFRFYHRQVILKSSSESLTGTHWFEKLGILRKYWLSITDPPEENLKKLQKIRPHHLHGYPSGLISLAEFLQAHKQTFHIPIVCTGAEVLDKHSRYLIQQAFETEVFDLYGTREVGNIAWECRAHDGSHINDDVMIVELLDEKGEEVSVGEEGEVVVTYLDALEYPFIRYSLEDRAIRGMNQCPCGVQFSKLKHVTGRSDERILLPSGEWISGMVFQELRAVPWLSAFRIIQDNRESIRLRMVPKYAPKQREIEALVTRTKNLIHGKLHVIPEVVDKFENDVSGKLRAVICRVK